MSGKPQRVWATATPCPKKGHIGSNGLCQWITRCAVQRIPPCPPGHTTAVQRHQRLQGHTNVLSNGRPAVVTGAQARTATLTWLGRFGAISLWWRE